VIFVDTGAWFAVAVRNDPDHEAAMRWLRRNREPLTTTGLCFGGDRDSHSNA
jgi:predicted nucleic acid-binding protein